MRLLSLILRSIYVCGLATMLSTGKGGVPDSTPVKPRYVFDPLPERFDAGTATITALAQDGPGFLWMGTQEGLLRYDGGRITRYGREEGLPTLFIDQIAVASDGKIWVGTNDGVSRFDGVRFRQVPIPVRGARLDSTYQIIAPDDRNGIYIGTTAGLLRVDQSDPSKYRMWARTEGLPSEGIEALFFAPDHKLYFICGNRIGLLRQENGNPEILAPPIPLDRGERTTAVVVDGDGIIWARTNYHVLRLAPGATRFVRDDEGIPKANDFGVPVLDRSNHIMLPTVRGLFRRINGGWESVNERQGMLSDAVFAALEDRDNAIWVGFGGSGVARWPQSTNWSAWTKAEGLPDSVVWSEIRDMQGRLWVGTDNGLAMWDARGKQWRVWTETNGLAGATVRELTLGHDGAIWALSIPGGLSRIDPATLRATATPMPAGAGDATGMAVAPDGRLWAGNSRCLKTLSFKNGQAVYENVEVPPQVAGTTSHPVFAQDGTMWSSGRKGISRFDGHKWTTYTMSQGLRANVVSMVLPVSGSEIWFRYVEPLGLGHLKLTASGVEVTHTTTDNGLATNAVFLAGRDKAGNLWVGGNRGVNIIDPAGKVRELNRADGLIWNDLSSEGFWADPDGSVYLGTSRGLVRYSSRNLDLGARHAGVIITSASLGGKEQMGARDASTPHARGTFSAQFAELSFRDPEKTPCRYRMAGLETEYTETLGRDARYVSLPSGRYQFEVACRYQDGVWSAPVSFNFEVAPAWWQSWWSRLAGLFLLASAILVVVRLRTHSLESERTRLEEAVAARNVELARANRELAEAALTDPLTKARNRRFLEITIEADVQTAVRSYFEPQMENEPKDLIFYLVDFDHFKRVNDEFGHQAGDLVLTRMAERLQRIIRSSETLIRWGGEEFMIVSRGSRREVAESLAQRILEAIGGEPLELEDGNSVCCTCSVGWAAFPWITSQPQAHSAAQVIQFADRALYMAKHSGRDQSIGLAPAIDSASDDLQIIRTLAPGREIVLAGGLSAATDLRRIAPAARYS